MVAVLLAGNVLSGCGDACERLCRETSLRLASCIDGSTTWADLGARNRVDFVDQCQAAWDRTSAELTTSDLGEAVEICAEGHDTLATLTCDEIRLLYAR
ncbi:MAG: hypothetical protein KC656_11820 [Myxococcales bacterium]|nr:hypothetical protein [Myxococcales bacterium]MCB9671745.1 hypothetical protein [Alphaproteobacteria bacterium]